MFSQAKKPADLKSAAFKVNYKEASDESNESASTESADDLEQQIARLRETANQKRQEEHQLMALKVAKDRDDKFKRLEELKGKLEKLNNASSLAGKLSLDDAMKLSDDRKTISVEIEKIEFDLGFRTIDDPAPEKKKTFGLSSSKAIMAIAGLSLLSFLLFWGMGTAAVIEDPMNDSARRMMNSVGLRVLTNFLPFSMAILTAVGFIWLLFPSVFAYWHSKVTTNLSLITDLEQCEPHHRVAFFAFSYALPIWAFVQLMQVIFG